MSLSDKKQYDTMANFLLFAPGLMLTYTLQPVTLQSYELHMCSQFIKQPLEEFSPVNAYLCQ